MLFHFFVKKVNGDKCTKSMQNRMISVIKVNLLGLLTSISDVMTVATPAISL